MKDWTQLESIVADPFTREPLVRLSESTVGTESGRSYPLVNGVPVLRPGPAVEIKNPDHVSNATPAQFKELMVNASGPVLFLGAGALEFRADHVFEVEYNLFKHTDVVGDAHGLPFRDSVFSLVVALNVFEHLREPHVAAAELHRVMRPGARVIIHTAYLQILHEAPHHYYGATEFGVRQWFTHFSDVQVNVSGNFNPFHAMSWFVHDLLWHVEHTLGPDDRRALEQLTLRDLANGWGSPDRYRTTAWNILSKLPPAVQKQFAAGFELMATK